MIKLTYNPLSTSQNQPNDQWCELGTGQNHPSGPWHINTSSTCYARNHVFAFLWPEQKMQIG